MGISYGGYVYNTKGNNSEIQMLLFPYNPITQEH